LLLVLVAIASWLFPSLADAAAPPGAWWDASYAFRQQITVTAGTVAVPNGYSVSVTFDHASLVTAGESLANGDDMRVVFCNSCSGSTGWVELDRVLDESSAWNSATTKIWLKTRAAIAASGSDGNYYLYRSNPAATNPPANAMNVYLLHDNFPGSSLDASKWTLVSGTATVAGGLLTVNANSRVFATATYAFGTNTRWEARIRLSANNAADFNYLTATTQADYGGNDWVAFWSNGTNHFVENNAGGVITTNTYAPSTPTAFHVYAINREGTTNVRYFQDVTQVGNITTNVPTVNLRFLFYNLTAAQTQIYDWVKVRRYVTPEPTTALGNAQAPTAVKLKTFTATMTDAGVLLRWRTGHEVANLGFHVYREEAGQRLRLTPSLLAGSALLAGPGTHMTAGHTYTWGDPAGMAGSQYWLEDVDLNGTHTWHGPVSAAWTAESEHLGAQDQPLSALLKHLGRTWALGRGPGQAGGIATGSPATPAAPLGPPLWAERRAAPPVATPETLRRQWALAARPAIKLLVKSEGWYRVPQPALVAAGLDPRVDARTLQLFADGAEQPLYLSGRADRALSPDEAIEFYGVGLDTPWTDTRTYWLTWGSQRGQRVPVLPARGRAPALAPSCPFTVERQDRVLYAAALLNGEAENFFGPVISLEPVAQDLALPHVDPAAPGDAQLEVVLQGLTAGPHTVRITLNGGEVGTLTFADQTQGVFRKAIPQASLLEGVNRLTLVTGGVETDVSAVDTLRLAYWHSPTADDDQLRCLVPGGQAVTLAGFSSPRIGVVDITDPQAPQRLQGAVRAQGSAYALTLTAPGSGNRTLLAFVDDRVPAPAAVTPNHPSAWHEARQGADLLILTHPAFLEAAQPLQALHEGQGLKVALIEVGDLYDEFSFGAKNPGALRAFLQRATTQWRRPPRFVLLLGGASVDPRNYLGFGELDFVPTKLVDTALLETASDDWFADFSGSGVPHLALGRLPVRTVEEATTVIQKIVGYARGSAAEPWTQAALLVADANDAFDFEAGSAQIAALLAKGFSVQRINVGQVGFPAARAALLTNLNQGQGMVHYLGHGSVEVWDTEGVLTSADAETLTNGPRLPFVAAMTCLNGFFHDPYTESLAAALLTAAQGGAVAVWASSGLTEPDGQLVMDRALVQLLFTQPDLALGEAVRTAKAAVSDPDIRRTWIFFGDPTMRLKHHPAP
jgi:hypothetical protein